MFAFVVRFSRFFWLTVHFEMDEKNCVRKSLKGACVSVPQSYRLFLNLNNRRPTQVKFSRRPGETEKSPRAEKVNALRYYPIYAMLLTLPQY